MCDVFRCSLLPPSRKWNHFLYVLKRFVNSRVQHPEAARARARNSSIFSAGKLNFIAALQSGFVAACVCRFFFARGRSLQWFSNRVSISPCSFEGLISFEKPELSVWLVQLWCSSVFFSQAGHRRTPYRLGSWPAAPVLGENSFSSVAFECRSRPVPGLLGHWEGCRSAKDTWLGRGAR